VAESSLFDELQRDAIPMLSRNFQNKLPADRLPWRPDLSLIMRQMMEASLYNIDHLLLSYLRLASVGLKVSSV
jgi:hypothetical protein